MRADVQFIALQKPPGHAYKLYPRLFRLFREMRPAIVHSRNLAALETVVPAWAAGVPIRIHGEHGRDMLDLHGANRKYQWVRKLYRPYVTQYIALSRDLERYLCANVGVPPARVEQIYNGVDALKFRPAEGGRGAIEGCPFRYPRFWLVGTVGRMDPVKDPLNLVRAFIQALQLAPAKRERMRLLLIGDGALYSEARAMLGQAGIADLAWLPGERNDVPDILRGLDCFVLPSLGEGISIRSSRRWRRDCRSSRRMSGATASSSRRGPRARSSRRAIPMHSPYRCSPMRAIGRRQRLPGATGARASSGNSASRRCSAAIGDSTIGSFARKRLRGARQRSVRKVSGNEAMCGITESSIAAAARDRRDVWRG
jgi:hypothetical protein